jgi:hypothetical protein
MTTGSPHLGVSLLRTALALLATVAALGAGALAGSGPAAAAPVTAGAAHGSYGWPVKPFFRQHPIRGAFGDPRILGPSRSFHFGVDVSCANGTPVYATATGRAARHPLHGDVVLVHAAGSRTLEYWHIRPLVPEGAHVVAYRTIVGTVEAPWEHVHLAERLDGVYVNPLRAGALTPYVDRTRPSVRGLAVESAGRVLEGRRASGRVDLVVEAYDATPLPIAGPWGGKPVTPALLEWRLLAPTGTRTTHGTSAWRTALDVRRTYPANELWSQTYARWTRQNKKHRIGRYRFALVHGLDTTTLANGRWTLQVRASDVRGNATTAAFALVVANV